MYFEGLSSPSSGFCQRETASAPDDRAGAIDDELEVRLKFALFHRLAHAAAQTLKLLALVDHAARAERAGRFRAERVGTALARVVERSLCAAVGVFRQRADARAERAGIFGAKARKVVVQPADKPLGALLCRLAAAALTHEREHPAPHAGEVFLASAVKAQILRRAGEDLLALRLAKAPFERGHIAADAEDIDDASERGGDERFHAVQIIPVVADAVARVDEGVGLLLGTLFSRKDYQRDRRGKHRRDQCGERNEPPGTVGFRAAAIHIACQDADALRAGEVLQRL